MFPGNAEYVAREQHQAMLQEAEQRRLVEIAQRARLVPMQQLANWTGGQLVKWGDRLKGEAMALPPRATAAGVTDAKYC